MTTLPEGYVWDSALGLGEETEALSRAVWPNYLVDPSDLPDEDPLTFEISPLDLERRFPVWGIREAATGKLVAYLNGLLTEADLSGDVLPDGGWEWAIRSAFTAKNVNCLCLVVAVVDPGARALGLSHLLLEKSKDLARALGLRALIAPVRPTSKAKFPKMPMAEYLALRDSAGRVFDPWLGIHVSHGAEILNVCSASVTVRASLARWASWLGQELTVDGAVTIPGALVPLQVNRARGIATYREPNVWVRYRL